jgi:hypothetical protein
VRGFRFEPRRAVKTRLGGVGPELRRDHGSAGLRSFRCGPLLFFRGERRLASSFLTGYLASPEPWEWWGSTCQWCGEGSRGRRTGERVEFPWELDRELIKRVSGGGALRHVR